MRFLLASTAALLLSGCAGVQQSAVDESSAAQDDASRSAPVSDNVEKIAGHFGGRFSNIAQTQSFFSHSNADDPLQTPVKSTDIAVYDLDLFRGQIDNRIVLVTRRVERDRRTVRWRLYELRPGQAPGEVLVTVAGATDEQVTLPAEELLAQTLDQVQSDCVIKATWDGSVLSGTTPKSGCDFQHPVEGRQSLSLAINFSHEALQISEQFGNESSQLNYERVDEYSGLGFLRLATAERPLTDSPWQQAMPFNLWTNGQAVALMDETGADLGYSIALQRMPWKNESDINLRMSVINNATGGMQGYSWAPLDADAVTIEQGWINIRLEPIKAPSSAQSDQPAQNGSH